MASVITDWAQWIGGQSAASGALSLLYCATAPELEGKCLYSAVVFCMLLHTYVSDSTTWQFPDLCECKNM